MNLTSGISKDYAWNAKRQHFVVPRISNPIYILSTISSTCSIEVYMFVNCDTTASWDFQRWHPVIICDTRYGSTVCSAMSSKLLMRVELYSASLIEDVSYWKCNGHNDHRITQPQYRVKNSDLRFNDDREWQSRTLITKNNMRKELETNSKIG